MKLSALIADAERTLKEFGDLEVVVPDEGCGCCRTSDYYTAEAQIVKDKIQVWEASPNPLNLDIAYVISE